MRLAVLLLAVMPALAEDECVREGSPSGGDVDWTTSSKVERREVVEPAVRIPRPAGDGAVHNSSPAESKDKRRQDTATLKATANDDLHGAGAEEHLVEAEDDLGDDGATARRCGHDVLHAEIRHVANEGTGRARVGERVAPEHPLERRHRGYQEGLEE